MKRKVKRYNEGELVDSFSEYQGFGQMGPRTIQEDINAEEENRKPQMRESISVSEFEEPGTAGFNRAPIKMPEKPRVQTAVKQPPPKAQPKPAEKRDVKAEIERLKAYDKPLETSAPEMALLGGPLVRGAKALGSNLLSKLAPKAANPRVGFSGKQADKLTKDMGPVEFATQRNKRRQLTGNRRSDDVIEMGMKKGGKVGSASSRADGIAMRGKTRGKYI